MTATATTGVMRDIVRESSATNKSTDAHGSERNATSGEDGGEDGDEEQHEAAATPCAARRWRGARAGCSSATVAAADPQQGMASGVTVNRPKRSSRGQPVYDQTKRRNQGKRRTRRENRGTRYGYDKLCGQRQREEQGGARAHDSGRKGVHTTNGESRCGQARCRKAAQRTWVAKTGRTLSTGLGLSASKQRASFPSTIITRVRSGPVGYVTGYLTDGGTYGCTRAGHTTCHSSHQDRHPILLV